MTLREALEALGTTNKSELARALGIKKQAVNNWDMDKPIPELREKQLKYEILPSIKQKQDTAA